MRSRKLFKQVLIISLVLTGFILTFGFAAHRQSNLKCPGVKIVIRDSAETGFVTTNDIQQMIQNKFGPLKGINQSSINISLLEKIINTNPFIADAEVFSTVDGRVNIEVKQRIPVLRVINFLNESFYIDDQGVFMPTSDKFTARVPVANGFVYERENGKRIRLNRNDTTTATNLEKIFNIVQYTNSSSFWRAEAQQFYVNQDNDIEMIPRVGNHSIVLGDDQNIEDKFNRLFVFYKDGISKGGWNKYRNINLKFKDQVVCTIK